MNGHIEEEKMALLAGGDLDDKEAAEFERHLSECPACSARVESYREDRLALSGLRETGIGGPDYEFVRRSVMRQIPAARSSRFRFAQLRWVALAAAALMGAMIGIGYWIRIPAQQRAGLPENRNGRQVAPNPAYPVPRAGGVAETSATRPAIAKPERIPRAPRQKLPPSVSLSPAGVAAEPVAIAHRPQAQDEVIIKLETSDPNVVIIWLASPKGGER